MLSMGCTSGECADAVARIETSENLKSAVDGADMVIEAAPEKLELKQALFAEIEQYVSEGCVLASNTSVLPITAIMSKMKTGGRALGTHWWNPPHMIPLVEVICTADTDPDVVEKTMLLLARVGKKPVRVEKDVPGFIGNRLQHALWREAVSLVENGICDAKAVDTVVKESFGRRLAVLGPLENADLVGTDLTLAIHSTVLQDLENRPGPSPFLEGLVAEGKLGMKSGEGFRAWSESEAQAARGRVARFLKGVDALLQAVDEC